MTCLLLLILLLLLRYDTATYIYARVYRKSSTAATASAQVAFTTENPLPPSLTWYRTMETFQLRAPLAILVMDQVLPVLFRTTSTKCQAMGCSRTWNLIIKDPGT